MTQAEAAKLVAVLMAAYPANRATPQTSQIYERMLADLEYPAANAAVERLLATAKWMPTVAEIRETALAITVGERKPGGEAWGSVLKAISAEGYARTPGKDFVFSDPVTARCVALMGWERLCSSENEIADRARFTELYDQLAVQERRKQMSDSLPAMQRFKALEAQRAHERQLEQRTGETEASGVLGKVLAMAVRGGDE